MKPEVRYHMLRPARIVMRRKECPVVYIPLGTLEWHGVHNPVGADTLQAEGIAERCAVKGGGLVFPPLYYGENRSEGLMEANAPDREEIAAQMELDASNFSPDKMPYSPMEQSHNYNKLLIHILAEAEALGFSLGVFVAGHYPLIDHARAAVLFHNQRRIHREDRMLAWCFVDYLFLADEYDCAGDHGGVWETSHLMHICPESVDLSELPSRGGNLVGISSGKPPQDSSAEFGEEIIEKAVGAALKEVEHRLRHPEFYRRHGCCLSEGLWNDAGS